MSEPHTCPDCGKEWLCKGKQKCEDNEYIDGCEPRCLTCMPSNIGTDCEEISMKEKVIFT